MSGYDTTPWGKIEQASVARGSRSAATSCADRLLRGSYTNCIVSDANTHAYTNFNGISAQFASITEHEQEWRDYEENIGACAFAPIGTTAKDFAKRLTCRYTAQTVTLTAKTAAREMRALPKPPSDIDPLVARTPRSLDVIAKNDASRACNDTESEACDAAETQANGDIRPLIPILDAWKPYTR